MKHARRSPRTLRSLLAAPVDAPWWEPVGLWQVWGGAAFLAISAVLAHWG